MKLLSTTILATAALAVAGAAQAGPSYGGNVLNGQLNFGDTSSKLSVNVSAPRYGGHGDFTKVDVTSAAIGNNLNVDVKNADKLNFVANGQVNTGNASSELSVGESRRHHYYYYSPGAQIDHLEATSAAIGNSFTLTGASRQFADVKNWQLNDADFAYANAYIRTFDTEKLTATIAAIGNSASIEMDEDTVDDVWSKQKNYANVYAFGDIRQRGDYSYDHHRARKADVTVAAIGNSLSVETNEVTHDRLYSGDIDSTQINKGWSASAGLRLSADEVDVDVTTAAIGNSLNVELQDRIGQDIDSFQANRANVNAHAAVSLRHADHKDVDVTVAAIGNSANITVNGDRFRHNSFGDVRNIQLNGGHEANASLRLRVDGHADKITATSAAIGNNASIDLSGDFFSNIGSLQVNKADADARLRAKLTDTGDTHVDLTAAAIGNSLSIKIGD